MVTGWQGVDEDREELGTVLGGARGVRDGRVRSSMVGGSRADVCES